MTIGNNVISVIELISLSYIVLITIIGAYSFGDIVVGRLGNLYEDCVGRPIGKAKAYVGLRLVVIIIANMVFLFFTGLSTILKL